METVIWVGFALALFAGILTAFKKQVNTSDKLLSIWLFLLAFDYGNIGITFLSYEPAIIPSSFFLFNPAFYLYSRSLTDEKFRLKPVQLLHLLPYIFFEFTNHYYSLHFSVNEFLLNDSDLWVRLLFAVSFLISLIIYNTLSIKYVHKHRINLKNEFSNINQNQKLVWLLFIVISYIVYILLATFFGFWGFLKNDFELSNLYNYSATLALTFFLGFCGIRQDEIYKRKFNIEKEERYLKSKLSTERKEKIKDLIINYFNDKSPYLNPDLNMQFLSEELNIPKHQLTEVLNTIIGKNFFQFVNEYRVNAVKQKLTDPGNDKYSIESIGYDCGFSSKSSFFSVFKTLTGKTPLEFKNSVR